VTANGHFHFAGKWHIHDHIADLGTHGGDLISVGRIKPVQESGQGGIEVRSIRRDANEVARKAEKASVITEDDLQDMLKDVQELTDDYTKQIDELMEMKDAELMEI